MILAQSVADPRQALPLLETGMAAAQRLLARTDASGPVADLWKSRHGRSWLRCRNSLAECLWALGRRDEAVDHFTEILRLDRADHQGIRYVLAARLLELDRDEALDRLLADYDEQTTVFLFSRALRAFRRKGDSKAAREALKKARAANRHIIPGLLHGAPDFDFDGTANVVAGGQIEACLYLIDFSGGWKQTPGAITWLRRVLDEQSGRSEKSPAGPTPAVKKQLFRLKQRYGVVWQATFSRVPAWMRDGQLMVRPWSVLIVNLSDGVVVHQQLANREPTAALLFDVLSRAMRKPGAGKSHRPSEIQVREHPLWRDIQPHLEEIGVDCIFREDLEETDLLVAEVHKLMQTEGQPAALVASDDFSSAQGASLYEAAAAFFRRRVWQKLPQCAVIQIESLPLREFGPGRWYAVVFGQDGQAPGLAIHDELSAASAFCGGCCSDTQESGAATLSLTYGENFEIPIADLLAAEQHRWPLASPEAWPLVACASREATLRPLAAWERQLLEGCLRAIPDFVERFPCANGPARATFGQLPPANLKLTLSWATAETGACGNPCRDCDHQCE